MKTYRVFLNRHYIAIEFYDIKAKDKNTAKRIAEKGARKLLPNVRNIATDNGWIADEPVKIKYLGYSSTPFKVTEVFRYKDTILYK